MRPKEFSNEQMRKFLFYTLEEATRRFSPGVETYLILADFSGSGFSNINLSQMKELAPIIQDCYTERMHMMVSVNANLLLRTIWTLLKPFLDEITIKKVFVDYNP